MSQENRRKHQQGPSAGPPSDLQPPPTVGPWEAGAAGPEAGEGLSVMADILLALQRIERRLRRIEEHLGVLDSEPETETPATKKKSGGHGERATTPNTPGSRTSPYA